MNRKKKLKDTDAIGNISVSTLDRAYEKIAELTNKINSAFTNSEKEYIEQRVKLMADNFEKLKGIYDKSHKAKYVYGGGGGGGNGVCCSEKMPQQQKQQQSIINNGHKRKDPKDLIKKNNDIEDIEDQEPIPANKAEQLRMHDEDKRKIGMEGRSFNSGFHGYTSKEVKELEKLIPDIHIPVKIKGILSPRN